MDCFGQKMGAVCSVLISFDEIILFSYRFPLIWSSFYTLHNTPEFDQQNQSSSIWIADIAYLCFQDSQRSWPACNLENGWTRRDCPPRCSTWWWPTDSIEYNFCQRPTDDRPRRFSLPSLRIDTCSECTFRTWCWNWRQTPLPLPGHQNETLQEKQDQS